VCARENVRATSDHIGRHHDKRTFVASLGKASIGTSGSRLCDTCTDEVSPGKASDDPSGGSHDDAPISHRPAKRIKATANDHPKVWPEKMMTIIKSIVETSTQERPRMTRASETTLTTPKREETLVVTRVAVSGCPRSPNSIEHRPSECLVYFDGGNTSESRSGIGGGGSNRLLEHRFQTQPVRQDTLL
jgi:hypothetical protein